MARNNAAFEYDNTLNGLVERVTTTLGDDEKGHANVTYDYDYLAALACDALVMLAKFDEDLITPIEVEFDIVADSCIQRLPAECEDFISWLRVEDDNGRKIPIVEGDYELIQRSAGFPQPCRHCRGDVMSVVTSYSIAFNEGSDRVFAFSPMLPSGSGAGLRLVALCRSVDQFVGDGTKELPGRLRGYALQIQWLVLTLATAKDDPAASQQHFQNFLSLANLNLQQQAFARRLVLDEQNSNSG